jgi:hypothetical protein
MSVRAQAAVKETALAADTLVTNALGLESVLILPKINDGSGITVAVGKHYRVQNTAGGVVDVWTNGGRMVAQVPARKSYVLVAKSGTVQGEPDSWTATELNNVPSVFLAPAGAYAQADSVAIVACLVAHGLMKAE